MTEAVARPVTPSPASEPALEAAASATGRVDSDATPPATESRPSMAALWAEAGGDRDRYVGLLRDHGWASERVTLTEIVRRCILDRAPDTRWDDDELTAEAEAFGEALVDELGKHGYRVHDVARCIRPAPRAGDPPELGRPMTTEEEAALLPGSSPPTAGGPIEYVTPEGDRFLVPEGYTPGEKSSRCRSCDALILWTLTRNQKRAPIDPSGESHFSTCPDAPSWRKSA